MPILLRRWKCELSPAAFVLCDLRGTIHVSGGNVHPTWPPYRCTRLGSVLSVSPRQMFWVLGDVPKGTGGCTFHCNVYIRPENIKQLGNCILRRHLLVDASIPVSHFVWRQ